MAIVLRSDRVAYNPEADWEFMSPYGATHREVAEYLAAIMVDGFDPGQLVFNALDTFVTDLKESGIWQKVPEIMPLYGGSYAAICRKLKGEWGGMMMTPVNGDELGNYEQVGGAYIGRDEIAYMGGNGPALDTGFSAVGMNLAWGFSALLDTQLSDTQGTVRHLMGGTIQSGGSNRSIGAQLQYPSAHPTVGMRLAYFHSYLSPPLQQPHVAGLVRFLAEKTSPTLARSTYFDEDGIVHSSTQSYDEGGSRDVPIYLLARAPVVNEPVFNGKFRFAAFDNGALSTHEVGVLFDAINDLTMAMGKGF